MGRELAWQFVQENWDELYNRYAGGLLFARLIKFKVPHEAGDVEIKNECCQKSKIFEK